MGLDNGVLVKRKDGKKIELPSFVKDSWGEGSNPDNRIELAYWRKCWGIRNKILDVLDIREEDENCDYYLDLDELKQMIKVLMKFLREDYYNKHNPYWEYEDYIDNMLQIVMNLKWLETYMQENDVEVEFYDSY